jgi:hypothetical protein
MNERTNIAHVDAFTLAHAALGFAAARVGASWSSAVLFALAFELVEDSLKVEFPAVFPRASSDSKMNALTDVVAVVAGFLVGERGEV